MNDISLKQGNQFNMYQTKIKKRDNKNKKKEGFVSMLDKEQMVRPSYDGYVPALKNMRQSSELVEKTNQSDLDELNQLQTKYNDLMSQYTDIQKKIGDKSMTSINRVSSNNPYLGKNIKFTDGTMCYVTNQGIVKKYPSSYVYDNTVGKNGCPPKSYIDIGLPWSSAYIKGSTIPTNPSLIVGSDMTLGESCGNEGANVYVTKLISNPTSNYIGCYNDVSSDKADTAMLSNLDVIGYTTFDKCQDYSVDNGYKYFGLQNVQTDGTAMCVVSNDLDKVKKFGDASVKRNEVAIWSSNTQGQSNYMQLAGTGQLTILNSSGKIVKNINDVVSGCVNWGTSYINSATYGGNCKAPIGNVTNKVTSLGCNYVDSCSIPISNQTFGDPTPGCKKAFDIDYTCGGKQFTKNLPKAEGQTIIIDCNQYMQENCSFYLILQDDGNMSIYKGKTPSENKGDVWSAKTNGKQKSPNPNWISSKGKYGRNYLKSGEVLGPDEWIGSSDGSLKLIMQTDGNLVLYASEDSPGCKVINDMTFGGELINAVYELNAAGNRGSLGKLAYIDSESNLREYPDSMIGFTNDYQIYQNTDSTGNDISTLTVSDEAGCQKACNNNAECAGYVYQGSSQTCWLKNRGVYPKGEKQYNNAVNLGIRHPALKGSTTCSNKINNIDSIQYDNYIKGSPMTSDTQCSTPIVSQEDKLAYDNIQSQLITLGQDIAAKMEDLYNRDKNIYSKLKTNETQFKKDIEQYKLTNLKIKQQFSNLQSNNIEGMQNLNMNDINGMLSDSDMRVLQENYSYIMWSILAIGIVTVTINTIKK